MATIKIKNLELRAIIGINGWERRKKQNVIINVTIKFDGAKAAKSDNLKDTVDYKAITKNIIKEVQGSRYFLLEKLSSRILEIVLMNKKVKEAWVEVDKPLALRYSESVSVTVHKRRP